MKCIFLILLLFSLQSFAETGIECITPSSRCSAYNLDVDAEVLKSFEFIQKNPIELGQITKDEVVVVSANNFYNTQRGKKAGSLNIFFTASSENLLIHCLPGSSNVSFGGADATTEFDSCIMTEQYSGESGSTITLVPAQQGYGFVDLNIGGQITVPSDATTGEKSGSMRIEVVYE